MISLEEVKTIFHENVSSLSPQKLPHTPVQQRSQDESFHKGPQTSTTTPTRCSSEIKIAVENIDCLQKNDNDIVNLTTDIEFEEALDVSDAREPESSKTNPVSRKEKFNNFAVEDLFTESPEVIICETERINSLVNNFGVECPKCGNSRFSFINKKNEMTRFNRFVIFRCKVCRKTNQETMSKKIKIPKDIQDSKSDPALLGIQMAAAILNTGIGYTKASRFLSTLNIPPISRSSYDTYRQVLTKAMDKKVDRMREKAAEVIRKHYLGDNAGTDDLLNISVSFDGSWAKRGHDSNIGIAFIVEVETGIILDFEVMCKYCHICTYIKNAEKRGNKTREEIERRKREHSDCQINMDTKKSSGSMEGEIAKILFKRSVKRGLRYTTMVSDEDSSTFKKLLESNPYGDKWPIQKVNCLNHTQKKIYKKVEKARKEYRLEGNGGEIFTQATGTFFANIYRVNIRRYLGKFDIIRRNMQASIFHHASTDERPLHFLCPKGSTSWCKYQRTKNLGKEIENDWHKKKSNIKYTLNTKGAVVLFQIFDTMLTDEVLNKISGKTQNINESLHSKVWQIAPKTEWHSKPIVQYACGRVFISHNTGLEDADILQELSISKGSVYSSNLKKDELSRTSPQKRKSKKKAVKETDYEPGGF